MHAAVVGVYHVERFRFQKPCQRADGTQGMGRRATCARNPAAPVGNTADSDTDWCRDAGDTALRKIAFHGATRHVKHHRRPDNMRIQCLDQLSSRYVTSADLIADKRETD